MRSREGEQMNDHGHSDFSGLILLILGLVVFAVLVEGTFIVLFVVSWVKWRSTPWSVVFASAIILWALLCWAIKTR